MSIIFSGQVIVIGATNRIDSIDPALRRPGRFDRELVSLEMLLVLYMGLYIEKYYCAYVVLGWKSYVSGKSFMNVLSCEASHFSLVVSFHLHVLLL